MPQRIQPLPARLYSGAETRALDRIAIDEHGIPGIVLMKRAGAAAYGALRESWPDAQSVTVVCGKGNNAGDGYVVAGFAASQGLTVQLVQLGPAGALQGDAGLARDWAFAQGISAVEVDPEQPDFGVHGAVVVDALLGTGLAGEVRPGYARAIGLINDAAKPVLALDVPSGLSADTGEVLGVAVRAALTVTFIGAKQGLCTGAGVEHVGRVIYADLDVPGSVLARQRGVSVLDWGRLKRALGVRPANAYKNRFGHVLIVGGDHGMGGAVALAGEAALRCGAGLVSIVTRDAHVAPVLGRCPELMVTAAEREDRAAERFTAADVIAVGPGLGRADWGRALLRRALGSGTPCVVDADGLNLLAEESLTLPAGSIITPHPGEAARLLAVTNREIQADRPAAARALAARYRAVTVLKGAGTLVAEPHGELDICLLGNPAMATAGMGDVLTGVVAGLRGRMPARDAACAGTCLHSAAADRVVAERGERGLIAGDVVGALVDELNAGA